MEQQTKVVHELKLDKSIIKLLWAFAAILVINILPNRALIPEAFAEIASNPTIRVILGECSVSSCESYKDFELD
jgi:hypothetical protein|tara:strand:+ start:148 stop:369 length:222 start_codon:yes stop_codon:yes gene_type:complete